MSYLQGVNLAQTYQDKIIFENIDIQVEKNDIVAILGTSGIGKTTLLKMLAGLNKPSQGKVILDNQDITNQSGLVSYMPQSDLLLEHKTTLENVTLPLIIKGVKPEYAYEKALSYFKTFNLEGSEHYYPHKLSGGMKQRAAFLRTYLYNNEIMLLDEPFSSLDEISKLLLHQWFKHSIKKLDSTVVFISHDIDEALFLCNKIYVFYQQNNIIKLKKMVIEHNDNPDYLYSQEYVNTKKQILALISTTLD